MPGPNRNRLRRSSTIQIDNFLHDDEEEHKFKAPKFQPLSSRYKKREEKRVREEEEKFRQLQMKLKKKQEKEAEETGIDVDPEAEKVKKKAELEKVKLIILYRIGNKNESIFNQLNSNLKKKTRAVPREHLPSQGVVTPAPGAGPSRPRNMRGRAGQAKLIRTGVNNRPKILKNAQNF